MNLVINTTIGKLLESLGDEYSMNILFRDDSGEVKETTYVDSPAMKRMQEYKCSEVSRDLLNVFEILSDKGNKIYLIGCISGGTNEHPKTKYEFLSIVAGKDETDALEVYRIKSSRFPWEAKIFGEITWPTKVENQ